MGVFLDRVLGWTRDDQGGSGFVDKNGVDLIDDGEVMSSLHHRFEIELHVVAQVVEAELVVGTVGHVSGVGGVAIRVGHVVLDDSHGQTQEAVDLTHPLGVSPSEVVVDRNHMDPLAFQGIEVDRHRGDECLAFTGLHLGDHSLVQDDAADELDVEGPHPHRPDGGFTCHGECRHKEIVDCSALLNLLAEL